MIIRKTVCTNDGCQFMATGWHPYSLPEINCPVCGGRLMLSMEDNDDGITVGDLPPAREPNDDKAKVIRLHGYVVQLHEKIEKLELQNKKQKADDYSDNQVIVDSIAKSRDCFRTRCDELVAKIGELENKHECAISHWHNITDQAKIDRLDKENAKLKAILATGADMRNAALTEIEQLKKEIDKLNEDVRRQAMRIAEQNPTVVFQGHWHPSIIMQNNAGQVDQRKEKDAEIKLLREKDKGWEEYSLRKNEKISELEAVSKAKDEEIASLRKTMDNLIESRDRWVKDSLQKDEKIHELINELK